MEDEDKKNIHKKIFQNIIESIEIPKTSPSSKNLFSNLHLSSPLEIDESQNISELKKKFNSRDKSFLSEYYNNNIQNFFCSCYVKTSKNYYSGILHILQKKIIVLTRNYLDILTIENNNKEEIILNYSDIINSTYTLNNNNIINYFEGNRNKIVNSESSKNSLKTKENDDINDINNFFYPLLYLDFDLSTVKIFIHKTQQKFKLLVFAGTQKNNSSKIKLTKVINFKLTNEPKNVFDDVTKLIQTNILLSKGRKENIFGVSIIPKFLYEYFISLENFIKEVNTCDILLFRGLSFSSKCQRIITGSQYDHVALLIKKDKNFVYILDSTTELGVQKRSLKKFMSYHLELFYEKIVYRKLYITNEKINRYILENQEWLPDKKNNNKINFINNSYDIIRTDRNIFNENNLKKISPYELNKIFYEIIDEKIGNFVKTNLNKEYKFSKKGFCCKFPMVKNQEDKEGFFCSELVAAALYFCGLITDKLDSSNYFPKDFSKDGTVPFHRGIKLGPEYIIDFSN